MKNTEASSEIKINNLLKSNCGPVLFFITSSDMNNQTNEILNNIKLEFELGFEFYEILVDNWDDYLTPWPVDNCMKNRSFGGKGYKLLDVIKEESAKLCSRPIYIVGYSLAGLFSMWALYNLPELMGAICCSSSFWYPDWKEYISSEQPKPYINDSKRKVYISLGDKESKTKHPLMSKVGENTLLQVNTLEENPDIEKVIFEWNQGGHFDNVSERIANGIISILNEYKI